MSTNITEADIKAMVAQIIGGMGGSGATASVVAPHSSAIVEDATPEQLFAIPGPANRDAYMTMLATTSARLGEWRAGTRPTTASLLRFRADHAGAMDAVFNDVSEALPASLGLFPVQTSAPDKAAYLMNPDLGTKFTAETTKQISEHCAHGKQVQIIVSDGLSSAAVERNVSDLLPALMQGLQRHNLSTGNGLFVKFGRVRAMDEITAIVGCEVTIMLVGERPGLVTNESLSCYMTYKGHPGMAESSRTVVSNIYRKGTPPVEAGAYIADIAKKMIDTKMSGMDLKL